VTKPFGFEGRRRSRQADEGITRLEEAVDTLIVIPNNRLLEVVGANTSMVEAFRKADEVLLHAVQGISDLMTVPGLINVDFADVRTIMSKQGRALMGSGKSGGKNRAIEAAKMAISSPLLEDVSIDGATGILINITGGADLGLHEVNEASSLIQQAAHEDANIIFGSVIDPNIGDEVRITVIATGFERPSVRDMRPPARPAPRQERSTGSQVTLPYEQHSVVTRDYPPATVRPRYATESGGVHAPPVAGLPRRASGTMPARYEGDVDVPIHEAAEVDAALAELGREPYAEMTVDAQRMAMGSGPIGESPLGGAVVGRGRPEFPKVHPSLRHVLAEVEVDSELDVPTFLRRNHPHG
jgi:cell division protein FtsZ